MAEMLVALWLSCCKPQSPGRVKPTFKPKPRYRQPGQQQWHISTYPKTKCPSFVCNPHSSNLASQHMELSLGGLREIGVVLCSHLTAQYCLEELRWNFCETGLCDQCWFFLFFFFSAWLYCWLFFPAFLIFFYFACVFLHCCVPHWWANTNHLAVELQSEQQLDIKSTITYQFPVNPFLTSRTFTRGKRTHLSGKCFHMDTKSGPHSCGNESRSFNLRDIINKW